MTLEQSAPVLFAMARLEEACRERGASCAVQLTEDGTLPPKAYSLSGPGLTVRAADREGAMTALLDLRDSILAWGEPRVEPGLHRPYIGQRGIKLNLPLDARTPSYSDCGDSAQLNIQAVWDEGFWQGLLDRMALNRYNTLTLWNLCPFPSMVRVPEYPKAALDDVMISSFMAGGTSRALSFYTEEMKRDLVRVKRMTPEEKTAFWNRVFRYAADRCIDVYLFTWNLYLYGLEDSGYPLTERADDAETGRYIRCSTAALLRAFPLLRGIGVTAGENLCAEWTEQQDMRWVRETYGRGIEDALRDSPGRPFTLICRTHMTTLAQLGTAFADYKGDLMISVKYAMAHMTAAERPVFTDELLKQKEKGLRVWMTLRQDDFYLFPWADDTFLTDFFRLMPQEDLEGFYYGADGIVWGLESQSRDPRLERRYFVDKHFFAFALVGRLGYKGRLDTAEKEAILREKLPNLPADRVLNRLRLASRAVRLVSVAHWRHYDFQWYPEACCYLNEPDRTVVFDDLNSFLRCGACPGTGVAAAAETPQAGNATRTVTDIAEEMLRCADLADGIRLPDGESAAEREMTADLRRITSLARYYAFKLLAAVSLNAARQGGGSGKRAEAAALIKKAAGEWLRYSDLTARCYKPQRLSRLRGVVSPDMWDERVKREILICEQEESTCSH